MAINQLLNPIETVSMDSNRDHIELSRSAFGSFSREALHGIIRSNINRSLERINSKNLEMGLERN